MQDISSDKYYLTSVSLRPGSKRRLKAALLILARNGIHWSESELLQRLAKVYLRHWRGRKKKSASLRRKNASIVGIRYVRVPWYVNQVLYAALQQRSLHSGEVVSRMLDFAIRYYMPRSMEELLSQPVLRCAFSERNLKYWRARYKERKNPRPEIFVTYQCKTALNAPEGLAYRQEYRILTKKQLFASNLPPIMLGSGSRLLPKSESVT